MTLNTNLKCFLWITWRPAWRKSDEAAKADLDLITVSKSFKNQWSGGFLETDTVTANNFSELSKIEKSGAEHGDKLPILELQDYQTSATILHYLQVNQIIDDKKLSLKGLKNENRSELSKLPDYKSFLWQIFGQEVEQKKLLLVAEEEKNTRNYRNKKTKRTVRLRQDEISFKYYPCPKSKPP